MSTLAIMIAVAGALAAAAAAAWLWVRAGTREREEEVLMRLRAGAGADDVLLGTMGVGRAHLRNPLLRAVCFLVWRTGSDAEPEIVLRWLLAGLGVAILLLVVVGVFGGLTLIALALAFSYAWLSRQAARRRALIISQMPEFLESVMRILSAGNTLEEALANSARESPEPIRPLFISIGRQVRLGAAVEESLAEMGEIHKLRDLKVMAMAASVNRKYGGSLRNVLHSLVQSIRNREMATRELRALTAETRFSAWVLALIPISLTLFILLRNPGYYADMWLSGTGRATLVASVMLQVAGVVVLWRMLRGVEDTDQ